MTALIVTYHAVEDGPAPLCIDVDRFRAHLDCLTNVGAATFTVAQLVAALRTGTLPDRAVAITFDDGCASAVRVAAPLLAERGLTATFFCVAGRLGGRNDWPSQPATAPRLELAAAGELAELVQHGFEIGGHGMEHAPLAHATPDVARRELRDSKIMLEDAVGEAVRSFAYPYGVLPNPSARRLAEELYDAACGTSLARVVLDSDPFDLPRVDAHYLRQSAVLRRVAAGALDPYLRLRRLAATHRRALQSNRLPPGVEGA